MKFFWLAFYWTISSSAQIITKFGSTDPSRWIPSFILGNALGICGTWVLMKLYKHMDVNIASGLTLGGGFLITQILISLLFRTGISPAQYGGIEAIAAGLAMMVIGQAGNKAVDG
jgi:multidrug transporter EmrE-like cation transporter